MCGRYKFTPGEFADLRIRWNLDSDLPLFSSYNIAPTQEVPVVVQKDLHNHADLFRWGLVPFWAKDIAIGNQMIRAETLSEKPAFKRLVKDRRPVGQLEETGRRYPPHFHHHHNRTQRTANHRTKLGVLFRFCGLY